MKKSVKILLIFMAIVVSGIGFGFSSDSSVEEMAHIELTITDIRGEEGFVGVGVFLDHQGFEKEIAYKSLHFKKSNIQNGEMTVSFDLKPDVYGISLLDDENGNDEMDYNMFGIPKEGFGFADYYHSGFSKPDFETFQFELKPGETKKLRAKFRYIL